MKLNELKTAILGTKSIDESTPDYEEHNLQVSDEESSIMEVRLNDKLIASLPCLDQSMADELDIAITEIYEKYMPDENISFESGH